ncbi:hypothetical protein TNCT_527031 [Trichonephila clavata]|uniref:Uncharacterized protein n=1 Tax=Trichonephila clavata TaxID=2740835 RepID=A0A8X6GZM5_TRICU|nr:hypothetical protein TNCT_527031 [Trichonephila clavata]
MTFFDLTSRIFLKIPSGTIVQQVTDRSQAAGVDHYFLQTVHFLTESLFSGQTDVRRCTSRALDRPSETPNASVSLYT